ncbi:hypothetical protein [Flavobacterium pectinovorum]|jgi:hypothetical protein|uniref:Exo-alpha-sialidase n=1 Tax=Flavobacterium pectinovorum TaxID=29533 RepID=A0A502EU65_9FLAO|nr:hypothetical protein [Flavobacterium pectinovorum]TPG40090.1 hypothetical protein EAH81_12380 [Flavobacterium pectinovorum]
MKLKLLNFLFILIFCFSCTAQDEDDSTKVITKRITNNQGLSNAFTDLVFFDNNWFLSFRESDKHALGRDGIVKILSSPDGAKWNLVKEYQVDNLDLRDAMFAVNGNKLMTYVHGSRYDGTTLAVFKDFKSDYVKGQGWNNLQAVVLDKRKGYTSKIEGNQAWPWKITWYKGSAYSFAYGKDGFFDFYRSTDALNFQNMFFDQTIKGIPTEATLKVDDKGVFYVVSRRDGGSAIIGKSTNSGATFEWFGEIPIYSFGGPDFVFYKDGLLISGREDHKVILGYYNLKTNQYKKVYTLKSGGDCSYPGMVLRDNTLWMSYYSGHENQAGTSIYLSQIDLSTLTF